jgi:hypothetical protein
MFRGQINGKFLAEFLTFEKNERSRKLVLSLLQGAREVESHGIRQADGSVRVKESVQFFETLKEFNTKLKKYRIVPQFRCIAHNYWHFGEMYMTSKNVWPSELAAVQRLLSLASAGLLNQVRQCRYCKEWFFARFPNQHCCGKPRQCRIKLHQSTEEYKSEKREKAKAAYREKKARERRWLEMSKKPR